MAEPLGKFIIKLNGNALTNILGTNGSESAGEILSLTSLKISGYTVSSVETELVTANAEGSLSDLSVVNEATQLYNYKSEENIPGSDA